MDCDAISVECGAETECVGHIYRRGAFQRTWDPLVHHYRVFGDCVSHGSLRGCFIIERLYFTNRACAEAPSAAKRGRDSGRRPLA